MKRYFLVLFCVLAGFSSCSSSSLVSIRSDTGTIIEVTQINMYGEPYKNGYVEFYGVPAPLDYPNTGLTRLGYILPDKGNRVVFSEQKDEPNKGFIYLRLRTRQMLQTAVERSFAALANNIKEKSTVAILNVSLLGNHHGNEYLDHQGDSEYIVNLLTSLMVDTNKFVMVERNSLEFIRLEQQFQLSGDVDDNTAVSVGKMLGADIVITGIIRFIPFEILHSRAGGNISRSTTGTKQLVIKALNTRTGQIVAMSSQI